MASYRFTGARVWSPQVQDFIQRDLFVKNGQIVPPISHAQTIALDGHLIFPAVLNAHDHLELNHYPRTRFQEHYENAHQWGEDVNKRLNEEPFASLRAQPLKTRLWHGGLKNLLCGALTVFQHGPPHRPLFHADFPVYIPRKYGWVHSLHFNTAEEISHTYQRTPTNIPWFIHLAEGTDAIAAEEYQRLKTLGCIGANTVLVHGVGLREEDLHEAAQSTKGLVWCPSTNLYLLGQTAKVEQWVAHGGRLFLGSDSRLTADGDW
ncbi:MAG: amidohydrolase, partial [Chloroflexi bacterium]